MGLLVEGKWVYTDQSPAAYLEQHGLTSSKHHNFISKDNPVFQPEKDRYHLYFNPGCPYAHRITIIMHLKKLHNIISHSILSPYLVCPRGWHFDVDDYSSGDHLYGLTTLSEIYSKGDPSFTGKVSVPLLWDKKLEKIVSTQSDDIFFMFNSSFNEILAASENVEEKAAASLDFVGISRTEICISLPAQPPTPIYDLVDDFLINCLYTVRFADTQEKYDAAVRTVFERYEMLDDYLKDSPNKFLATNDQPLAADFFLFCALIRFDLVYHGAWKINLKYLKEFEYIDKYLKNVYQFENVGKQTLTALDILHIKHLTWRNKQKNPSELVPVGPELPSWMDQV